MSIRLRPISANLMQDGDFFSKGVDFHLKRIPTLKFILEDKITELLSVIKVEEILSGMISLC